ncbi:PhzF family phenazine biosynthesis protein [Halobacteriales archaeon QS_9_68_17]|nr:MAG: PhzF family phenazine biosynthesis protein [Halobacteriales archaeon QS_9_68_17]
MVRQVRTALVDAFTDEPLSGNAAGVVPDADGLSAAQMQAVARELAVSETAFLLPSGPADRKVRYFTPTQEVELCGHATVAAHAFLREDGAIGVGEHTLDTDVGVLDIDVEDGGTVWMTQDDPTVRRIDVEYERLFLTVPVNFLEHVGNADPDLAAVEALCDEVDATGLYLFTFDALDGDATLHARMFAPGAGVPEDPVTGTASGAAGAYLREVSAFDGELPDEMVFEQGHYLDRPGRVRVRVGESVRVGGDGVVALDGTLSVPADDEDGILEA